MIIKILEHDILLLHTLDKWLKIFAMLEFNTHHGRTGFPIRFLGILEAADIVGGAKYVQEVAESTGPLRKSDNEIVFQPLV